jgi:hypothetical protein
MVLQFEDCVDVAKALYPEYMISYGLDRKRPGGLCANSMIKGFGGKQTVIGDLNV